MNTESAMAATTLPAANNNKPAVMTRLRPMRSDNIPKGIWNRLGLSRMRQLLSQLKKRVEPVNIDQQPGEKTGKIMKRPSIRRAKILAKPEMLRFSNVRS